jgi:Xaa-Pro dipeptidase
MISRRSFFRRAAAVPAAAALPALATSAGAQTRADVPPSIAALQAMRGRARPISADERRARIERARALMAESKIDAVLLTGSTSLTYFTGVRWGNSERMMALIVPAKGRPFAVLPAFEEDRVREQITGGPLADAELRTWHENESPYELVGRTLRDRGVASGRLGVEETTRFVFADGIAQALPSIRVVSATPVVAGCRMIKDQHELDLLGVACDATLKCYEAVFRALKPGMTETDVRGLIAAAYARLGFSGGASVQVGEYTALPHGSATPQTIREGTIIMFDDGCLVEGYQSDLTRTFVLGKATDKMKRVFDLVLRAQTAALAQARPGVTLESVDAAARKVIEDGGFGPGYKFFTHRLGHGLGMDMHEWPYLVPNNMFGWDRAIALSRGMVFSDEPGIYIPGEFGVRLEDDMYITEDGARLFTPQSRSIEDPFA